MRHRVTPLLATAVVVIAACSACGSSGSGAGGSSNTVSGKVSIWASTDVWGSVARQVGGSYATVTSAIDSPTKDPHDYESTARDKLAVSESAVAVYNGGGYDDWARKLVTQDSETTGIDAVATSGMKRAGDDGFNEHVFWSLPTSVKVADAIAAGLAKKAPAHAAYFRANARTFAAKIAGLTQQAKTIGAAHPGTSALMTEPVVGYLLGTAGIADGTPPSFRKQSEGDSVSAVALRSATTALSRKKVQLLTVNAQTADATSNKLKATASQAGVPTVAVYETFPAGERDYLHWVGSCIAALKRALA